MHYLRVILTVLLTTFGLIIGSSVTIFLQAQTGKSNAFSAEELMLTYGKNGYFVLQLLPFSIALLFLLLCIKFIHKQRIKDIFNWDSRFQWKKVGLSFGLWSSVLFATLFVQYLFHPKSLRWNEPNSDFFQLVFISLVFVSIQTLFEEVLFRSYIQRQLEAANFPAFFSIVLTSTLFCLLHGSNPEVELIGKSILIYFFMTGLFLGIVSYYSKGLELSFGFHAANNLFASLILTNDWQIFQTDALWTDMSPPQFGISAIVYLFIVFPILLFIYSKVYKWNNTPLFRSFVKTKK